MKTFLVVVMCVYSLASFGQIRKGRMMVSGNLSFSNSNKSDDRLQSLYSQSWNNSLWVDVGGGYYVNSRMALGIDFSARSYSYRNDLSNNQSYGTLKQKDSSLRPAVFARFNLPMGQKFNFFFQPSIGLGFLRSYSLTYSPNSAPTENDSQAKTIDLRLVAGINYFIDDHFAIECQPGYISWATSLENAGDGIGGRTFDISLAMRSISFGVLYLFGGRD